MRHSESNVMQQKSAIDYLRTLSDFMLSTEVTDHRGEPLSLEQGVERAVQTILEVRFTSHKVMLTGNGGSAAIVSHVQNELCKAIGVQAMVFTEQPLLTALANDDGYGSVFEQPVNLWAQTGDLLMTVSSSGRSENILRGSKAALGKDCNLITLSGFSPDNPLRKMGHLNFYVPSSAYGFVEISHAALTHLITDRAMGILADQAKEYKA